MEGGEALTGTYNSDIFYGGQGNDTFSGKHGRDVAVYDATAWGQDTIAATDGTMTLLFAGLDASDITQTQSGTSLVLRAVTTPARALRWKSETQKRTTLCLPIR